MSSTARECGTCTACCKILGVASIKKTPNNWCTECDIGKGCKIYDSRPDECKKFTCHWLVDDVLLKDEDRPDKSKVIWFVLDMPTTIITDEAESSKLTTDRNKTVIAYEMLPDAVKSSRNSKVVDFVIDDLKFPILVFAHDSSTRLITPPGHSPLPLKSNVVDKVREL